MRRVTCPYCGLREIDEFRLLGPVVTDSGGKDAGDGAPRAEWWGHVAGCGAWFVLRRDLASGRIQPADRPGGSEG